MAQQNRREKISKNILHNELESHLMWILLQELLETKKKKSISEDLCDAPNLFLFLNPPLLFFSKDAKDRGKVHDSCDEERSNLIEIFHHPVCSFRNEISHNIFRPTEHSPVKWRRSKVVSLMHIESIFDEISRQIEISLTTTPMQEIIT